MVWHYTPLYDVIRYDMVWLRYAMARHGYGMVCCCVVSGEGPAGANTPPEQHVQLRWLRPDGNQGHQQPGPSRGPPERARARHGKGATEEEIPEELIRWFVIWSIG